MALNLIDLQSFLTIKFPSLQKLPSKSSSITLLSPKPPNPYQPHQLQKHRHKLSAVAVDISAAADDESVIKDEEIGGQKEAVKYDWSEEWYPLYLTKSVPDDAPLGLTVFDKQVVLFRDGGGAIRCYEDRCPHRLAKLSEGQIFDGRLECLYHGWQFEGDDGKCVKIPQLPEGAKIPASACVRTYEIKDSQGVIWIWMSHKTPPNLEKIPWFENFERPGFRDISTIHELPYDHSILLENLMDPAHVPISHDRTDSTSKREEAGPLYFEVTERTGSAGPEGPIFINSPRAPISSRSALRTGRGFAGRWGRERDRSVPNHIANFLRFEAPCVLQSNREIIDKNGQKLYYTGLFLCRPSGQGKSMLIVRFGNTKKPPFIFKLFPRWYLHQMASKILEQDMGFLSSQNEILVKENVPTRQLYINLKTSDTWVAEYRKWMDKVGHGMPYYFGHSSISLPKTPAVVEHAPAGFVANLSASQPAKGGIGTMHAPNPTNRYFRHVVHCRGCRNVVTSSHAWKNELSVAAAISTALAVLVSGRQWKAVFVLSSAVFLAGIQICSTIIAMNTTNFVRMHRR